MHARYRETCQLRIRHETFLPISDWGATRCANRAIAGSWRSPGDNDLRLFAHYFRARRADRQKRRELIGGIAYSPASADRNRGGGEGSGRKSQRDGEGDIESGGARRGILEDEPASQPGGVVGTGRGSALFSLFINPPGGHHYTVEVCCDTLVGDSRTPVNKRTPPLQAPWCLSFSSGHLDDNNTIGQGSTIAVNGRIKGGGGPTASKGGWTPAQGPDETSHHRH